MLRIDEKTGNIIVVLKDWDLANISGYRNSIFDFLIDVCINVPDGTPMNMSGFSNVLRFVKHLDVDMEKLSKEKIKELTIPTLQPPESPNLKAVKKQVQKRKNLSANG